VAAPVIAVANQKGGVGKTTTAVNLCAALAELGHRILLVDLDPQANATSGLGVEKSPGGSAYLPLLGEAPLPEKIQATRFKGLDLIPSEIDMCGVEVELTRMEDYAFRLREAMKPLREGSGHRLIFIDCPPSLGVLTVNALTAADFLLAPVQCEYYALEGVSMLIELTEQIRSSAMNPRLKLLGILMTMFDARTKLSRQVVEDVREHFGELVFETVIPRTTRLAEAPSHGMPIMDYDPYSVATAAYQVFAQEVAARLGLQEPPSEPKPAAYRPVPAPRTGEG